MSWFYWKFYQKPGVKLLFEETLLANIVVVILWYHRIEMLLSELTNFCVNNEKLENTGIIAWFESNKKKYLRWFSKLAVWHTLITKRLIKKKISSDMFLGFMFTIFGLYVINIFTYTIIKGQRRVQSIVEITV